MNEGPHRRPGPRYCVRCVLPDSRPGVLLDPDGICGGCRNADLKAQIDWSARRAAFVAVAENAKRHRASYDCVIPVSGGKDSYWQTVTCLEHGLRPLCVTYIYPGQSDLGKENLRNLVALGVEHMELRVDPQIEKRFIEKAFRTTAISGLVSHMAIYAWPLRVALEQKIPLVVYGENSAFEYGTEDDSLSGERVDRKWIAQFGVTEGTTAADWVDDELSTGDLAPFRLPSDDDLAASELRSIFMGYYFPWDPENSRRVACENGFAARSDGPRVGHYDFVNIDDDMLGVHHHPKWHKYGITRTWDTLSMEIRAGRLDRAAAIENLRVAGAETPWDDIEMFCSYLGIGQDDYFATLERFRNPAIWSRVDGRWEIPGFLIDDFDWSAP